MTAKHQPGAGRPWLDTDGGTGRRTGPCRIGRRHPAHLRDQPLWSSSPASEVREVAPALLDIPGCGDLDGGQARRRGRRGHAGSRARPPSPCHAGVEPDSGLVGQHRRADAVEPLGQPPTQLTRSTDIEVSPDPHARHRGPRLLPTAETADGEDQGRRTTLRQTRHSPPRVYRALLSDHHNPHPTPPTRSGLT